MWQSQVGHSLNPHPLPPVPIARLHFPATLAVTDPNRIWTKVIHATSITTSYKNLSCAPLHAFLLLPVWYMWDYNLATQMLGVGEPWDRMKVSSWSSAGGEPSADDQACLGLYVRNKIDILLYLFVTVCSVTLTSKTSLSPSFLSYKMGIVIVPSSKGFCEDQVN